MAKIGRPRSYETGETLKKAVERYFASISYEQPLYRSVPRLCKNADGTPQRDEQGECVAMRDQYGHFQYEDVPIVTCDGKPAVVLLWTQPPSIVGLCLFLGISRDTWCRYGQSEDAGFSDTVTRARGRIETYLIEQLADAKAARGAIFNLQQNFGWKEKKEFGLDDPTRKAMATSGMSMDEKLELLKSLATQLPEAE